MGNETAVSVHVSIPLHVLASKISLICNFFNSRFKEIVDDYYGPESSNSATLKVDETFLIHLYSIVTDEINSIKNTDKNTLKLIRKCQLKKLRSEINKLLGEVEEF